MSAYFNNTTTGQIDFSKCFHRNSKYATIDTSIDLQFGSRISKSISLAISRVILLAIGKDKLGNGSNDICCDP